VITLLPAMERTLKRQKNSHDWTKENGQYIPNPATWLNQGRWMDEPTEIAPVIHQQNGF
jgi:hypothetical protein